MEFVEYGLQATAKLANLSASLLAAGLGWGLLRETSPLYDQATQVEALPAGTDLQAIDYRRK